MPNNPVTLYCPNSFCQSPNPEHHRFCQKCRTPLPKRYLWAIGAGLEHYQPGDLLGDRFFLKQSQVLLDTRPGLALETPNELPAIVEPYLKLSPYPVHVPRIYGTLPLQVGGKFTETLILLEQAPIYPVGLDSDLSPVSRGGDDLEGTLMPELAEVWHAETALRQLHWLWQLARLWQPLKSEGVTSSLLTPHLVRAEGSWVRLLALQPDTTPLSLAQLGQAWSHWQAGVRPEIAHLLEDLCQSLTQEQITSADQLVAILDRALIACGNTQTCQFQVATLTDQGPSRQRNEDACYPVSGSYQMLSSTTPGAPVIVCDGIGGHEGGNVASNLAIEQIQTQVQRSLYQSPLDTATLTTVLEQAVIAANDLISQRNDEEQRQERQRMGTTVVMALPQAHELYLAHVGDSRAYWIGRTNCHQVTLDDDVASREVRMGYSLYRDALQHPASGSLVQALGMGSSTYLHPTVQRFVVDETCLLLLCSDGLSDNDRVEEYWQTELLPVLSGKVDLRTAAQRLVAIANSQNGHDNVTVGLVLCQVTPQTQQGTAPLRLADLLQPEYPSEALPAPVTQPVIPPPSPQATTQIVSARRRSPLPLLVLSLLAMLGLGAGLAYLQWQRQQTASLSAASPEPSPSAAVSPSPEPSPEISATPNLPVGTFLRVNALPTSAAGLPLLNQPTSAAQPIATLPSGSVLKVVKIQTAVTDQETWLELQVCSFPNGKATPTTGPLTSGIRGWQTQQELATVATPNFSLGKTELGPCGTRVP